MTESQLRFGAAASEWAQVSCWDTLAPWVLPVVSNPNVPISAKSSLKEPGKLPSVKNSRGEIVGISGWTTAPAADMAQLDQWSRDPDLGFCVRTGHNGIVAVDCDVDDPQLAQAVMQLLCNAAHMRPDDISTRSRGTARWAALVHLTDNAERAKCIIRLAGDGNPAVEILGAGQQLVCAGTHPRGQRYSWTHGIQVIDMTSEDFNTFCAEVMSLYGTDKTDARQTAPREKGQTFQAPDRLASWLMSSGLVLKTGKNGELYITCPWCAQHSGNTGEQETCYFPAGSNGYAQGGFRCLHAHCADKSIADFRQWAQSQGYTETAADDYPDETAVNPQHTTVPGTRAQLMRWTNERTGYIDPCITSVYTALADPDFIGWDIAYDTFTGKTVIKARQAEKWDPYSEAHNAKLRVILEGLEFRPGRVSKDLINDAVNLIADNRKIDTMSEFIQKTVPAWDGVPRCERFLSTYCGAEDSDYTRAVGRYFWGLLWRRASSPVPIKADISLVLIGAQGANKTQFIKALAIDPDFHTDLSFNYSSKELAMRMMGRIVTEYPEMRGFGEKKLAEIKAFLTMESDTYRPLYSSDQRTVTRRCMFIMTINNMAFLHDHTGNRRYAPVEVGRFDAERVKPDVLQLWAEGAEIFRHFGGKRLHQDVEAITEQLNEQYLLTDSWEESIREWLDNSAMHGYQPTSRNILKYALGFNESSVKREDLARLSDIMQAIGYKYGTVRRGQEVFKGWIRRP